MRPVTEPPGTGYCPQGSPAGSQVVFPSLGARGALSRRPPVSDAVAKVLVLVIAVRMLLIGDIGFEPVTPRHAGALEPTELTTDNDRLMMCRLAPRDIRHVHGEPWWAILDSNQ